MDAKLLRNLNANELRTNVAELRTELREAKFAGATQGGSKAASARHLRRMIARVLTILKDKHS